MYLLLAGNDTVPISMWRGECMRFMECRLAKLCFCSISELQKTINTDSDRWKVFAYSMLKKQIYEYVQRIL